MTTEPSATANATKRTVAIKGDTPFFELKNLSILLVFVLKYVYIKIMLTFINMQIVPEWYAAAKIKVEKFKENI